MHNVIRQKNLRLPQRLIWLITKEAHRAYGLSFNDYVRYLLFQKALEIQKEDAKRFKEILKEGSKISLRRPKRDRRFYKPYSVTDKLEDEEM